MDRSAGAQGGIGAAGGRDGLRRWLAPLLVAFAVVVPLPSPAGARDRPEEAQDLVDLELEDLLAVEIRVASKAAEAIADAPGIVSVISAEEIREFGAVSLFEVLSRAPSLSMAGSYLLPQNVASVRRDLAGHLDNHTLLLIDGRPFRDFTQGGYNRALYNAFPLDAIQRIEIIRGPGSVLYGTNAYSGVINIITKTAEDAAGGVASLGGGSYDAVLAGGSYGLTNDKLDLFLSARLFDEEGWTFGAIDEGQVADSTRYGERQLGGFGSLAWGNLTASVFAASSDEIHLGPVPVWPEGELTEDRYFADIGYEGELSQTWSLEGRVTYNRSQFEFPFAPPGSPSTRQEEKGFLTLNDSESTVFELTSRAVFGDRSRLILGAVADIREGETVSPVTQIATIPPYSDLWWGAYAQFDYRAAPWLKLVGGLQWNKPEDISSDVVPRAAAIFTFSEGWGAKLLYGEAFRAPTEFERNLIAVPILTGNPEVEPEKVRTTEAQVFYHREHFHLALTGFYSEQRDLILRVPTDTPPLDTHENQGEVRFQGIEVEGRYSFTEATYLTGSFLHAEDENRAGGAEVSAVSETMLKLGVAHRWTSGHSVGIFNSFFGTPPNVTGLSGPNPEAEAVNMLTANLVLNLTRFAGSESETNVFLKLHGINLLGEDVFFPEYVRRNLNTLPSHGGAAAYFEVEIRF